MKLSCQIVVVFMSFAALHQFAAAADKPSDLIVGKWRDRAEPDDAVIEFFKGGKGNITELAAEGTIEVGIFWKVTGVYGNACIIAVKYDSKAKEAKPFTWLIAFDGKDRFVTQPTENKIVFMQRQK